LRVRAGSSVRCSVRRWISSQVSFVISDMPSVPVARASTRGRVYPLAPGRKNVVWTSLNLFKSDWLTKA